MSVGTFLVAHAVSTATWRSWSFKPGVVLALAALASIYALGVLRLWRTAGIGSGISRGQAWAFACGWVALVVALVSPLDALSDALLSAHMVQHELLIVVAAPLIVFGAPAVALMWILPPAPRKTLFETIRRPAVLAVWAALTAPATAWLLHAVALWVWHLPELYEAALEDGLVHATQHVCFFATAALFWWGIAHGRYARLGYGAAVLYVFATALHSGILGALLTFSQTPWYASYVPTSADGRIWGLTALEDQQLAGLLMWVPAGAVFVIVGLGFFAAWMRESEWRVRFTAHLPARTSRTRRKGLLIPLVFVYLAGQLPNTPTNMQQIQDPREHEPHSAMPDTGVTDADARDIAAYLYTLR